MVQLAPVPAAGWKFSAWSGDLTGATNSATIAIHSDANITATFVEDVYACQHHNCRTGSVTRDLIGGLFQPGTPVQLTAVPADGWSFSGWSGARQVPPVRFPSR